ncbi:MAG: phBC6A51 family helix-turn-helix protein [Candidatus Poribacteria bacterium]|nr:phBC6A51 family helix-turn-helix protein [Candidatus Poribacteria bacterium]
MSIKALSIQQKNAIDLLLTGKNDRQVAEFVGVERVTVNNWRNRKPEFIDELNRRRYELFESEMNRLRSLIASSVEALSECINSRDERIKLAAATTLLKLIGLDRHPLIPASREVTQSTSIPAMSEIIKLCSETVVSSPPKNINT